MNLDIIRHGVTACNLAGRFGGDGPLVADEWVRLGRAKLAVAGYEQVYASPARRCVDTAAALGIVVQHFDPRIAERKFGVFEGRTPAQCQGAHPDDFEQFSSFGADFVIPGGESRADHFDRIRAWLLDLPHDGHGPVLAITHGGTVDFLYRLATGRALHGGDTIHAGQNGAMSSFRIEWPTVELLAFSMPLPG